MPLFYQHDINPTTKLAIWKIEEDEDFFLQKVPLQRTITHPLKRLQHLAGRYLLPYLFPDFPYDEILVADTKKPYLPGERYHFSISHCGNYAAAIVSSKSRVGIDIEIPSEKVVNISHKFLHPEEVEFVATPPMIGGLPPYCSKKDIITLIWCTKECMFKWWGWGEIDFSHMLRIDAFSPRNAFIYTRFNKDALDISLRVEYRHVEPLILVWLNEES